MEVAALVTWLLTAVGGFYMLGVWISRRQRATAGGPAVATTKLPPALIFTHFLLAAAGLVVWIIYVATDSDALAWIAFVILLPVALLGFTMLARWIANGANSRTKTGDTPESHFPVPVVIVHGLLAATTLVLVLLTALGVGS